MLQNGGAIAYEALALKKKDNEFIVNIMHIYKLLFAFGFVQFEGLIDSLIVLRFNATLKAKVIL